MKRNFNNELKENVNATVVKRQSKNNSNVIIVLVVLLVLVSFLFVGYVLVDKGIILKDNQKQQNMKKK